MLRQELAEMPMDKGFYTDSGYKLLHATGYEQFSTAAGEWWNEYLDEETGDIYLGR